MIFPLNRPVGYEFKENCRCVSACIDLISGISDATEMLAITL